jgi:hypothetical protein
MKVMEPNYFHNILLKNPYLFFIDNKIITPLALTVNIDLVKDNPDLFLKWVKKNENTIQNIIDTYIDHKKINEYNSSLIILKERIEIFYSNLFNIDDYNNIKSSIEFFKNYNLTAKTKKKKQELDINKNIISEYSDKYNINLFDSFKLIYGLSPDSVGFYSFSSNNSNDIGPIYENYLTEFKDIHENLSLLKKKTESELSTAIINYKEYLSSKSISTQVGKYFKKWSLLSKIEKNERILSFVSFYCHKYDLDIKEISDKMMVFIQDSILSKKLQVKDIKWNSSLGTITYINIKYDKGAFIIPLSQPKKKIIRFTDMDINELILNGILNNNDISSIKIKIRTNLELKRFNKTEESIIDSRFSEFNSLR